MAKRKVKRDALNRGTAVYLGGSKVRFCWPCGCKREETMYMIGKTVMHPNGVRMFVTHWRLNGVVLKQCERHPDWYSKLSQVQRLNEENPDEQ